MHFQIISKIIILLVHMWVIHELSISLAVGGIQGSVFDQQVDKAGWGWAQQVPAEIGTINCDEK